MVYNNILLIDDDEDDQEIFLTAVEEVCSDVKCITRNDASVALNELEKGELVPDLIFLDLNMPRMNGQQFLMEVMKRENLKFIPVIIFSTSSHAATIQLTRDLGATDFITKPGRYEDLVVILDKVICRK